MGGGQEAWEGDRRRGRGTGGVGGGQEAWEGDRKCTSGGRSCGRGTGGVGGGQEAWEGTGSVQVEAGVVGVGKKHTNTEGRILINA